MNDLAEQQAKRALRQEFLQRRRQLSAAEAAAASAEICRRLSACLAERLRPEQPGAVFSYLAYGREVDLAALHQELWRQGRPLAVPRTQGLPAGIMQAVYLRSEDELTRTERGIAEPSAAAEPCPPKALAAVLLPGVAFDAQGGRLGQGGGYYDRFLARLSPQTLLIGVAYDWQLAPTLPQAAWDRPVQLLATDKRLLDCATKC